jgi:tRNA pseudouridine38-40 synthase
MSSGSFRNIRLTIEYDGTQFSGWQRQPQVRTVQGALEERLKLVCGHPVDLLVAGRTDAGVHALGQTANFLTKSTMPVERIQMVLNRLLSHDIRIVNVQQAPPHFHSTYHALGKLYRYVIRNSKDYTVFDRNTHHHIRIPLDLKLMRKAASYLVGTHDFSSFRGTLGKKADPKRTLHKIKITKKGRDVWLEYHGHSFLHQMVRILSGTLVYAGLRKIKPETIPVILKAKDRMKAGPTLPPTGLFLVKVYYPKTFLPIQRRRTKREEE